MKNLSVKMLQILLLVITFLFFAGLSFLQDTFIKLSTSDNTVSFKVINSNDETILNARADGNVGIREDNPSTALDVDGTVTAKQFLGDGSRLTNVKTLAKYVDGNLGNQLTTNFGSYQNVKEVSITIQASGILLVTATGYTDWESENWDLFYGTIISDYEGNPNHIWAAEDLLFKHMTIVTDLNCTDSSDQYGDLTIERSFPVNSNGTYIFNLDGVLADATSKFEVGDVVMSAIYFPTGTISVANP